MTFMLRRSLKAAFYLIVWVSLLSCSSFFPPAAVTPTVFSPTDTFTPPPTSTITPTVPPTATHDARVTNPGNQHLYLYVRHEETWHGARDYYALRGSHLVTIETAEENNFIFQLTDGNTWLGATDEVEEGTWVWVNEQTWDYTNWDNGEPNNSCPPSNCGGTSPSPEYYLSYSSNGATWNDIPQSKMIFVCEWE